MFANVFSLGLTAVNVRIGARFEFFRQTKTVRVTLVMRAEAARKSERGQAKEADAGKDIF